MSEYDFGELDTNTNENSNNENSIKYDENLDLEEELIIDDSTSGLSELDNLYNDIELDSFDPESEITNSETTKAKEPEINEAFDTKQEPETKLNEPEKEINLWIESDMNEESIVEEPEPILVEKPTLKQNIEPEPELEKSQPIVKEVEQEQIPVLQVKTTKVDQSHDNDKYKKQMEIMKLLLDHNYKPEGKEVWEAAAEAYNIFKA